MDLRIGSESADQAVQAFLAVLAQLRHDLSALSGVDSVANLIRRARVREIPKEGKLGNGVEYAVHGVGCRFTTVAGVEIDVDIDDEMPVFDAWRVSNFADSDPDLGELPLAEVTAAVQRLVSTGELHEVRPGWYASVS